MHRTRLARGGERDRYECQANEKCSRIDDVALDLPARAECCSCVRSNRHWSLNVMAQVVPGMTWVAVNRNLLKVMQRVALQFRGRTRSRVAHEKPLSEVRGFSLAVTRRSSAPTAFPPSARETLTVRLPSSARSSSGLTPGRPSGPWPRR